ncbi:RNA ligase [Mycobacterium phage Yeet]|uniref:RNA ligase n=1 Tax=Mycobacterium phage Redno2 TaxID=1340709 RepID=UPI000387A7D5|nr:RNA ligase [Mycobacterium phage Redno2]QDM57974.1 RNA ligase [Mycobacterium phage NihilNomen]QED12303.1 RNA ligase [Mycobacterium phage Yeet]UEM46638.1 RNA ligase [Mycobacterium phage JuicyJay]WNM72702.1 RNA ligase [Mycobacterium phage Bombitas]AGS82450.1 RNA ligase [Mycobacterium phage Redno2]
MKFDPPANSNYACMVVKIPATITLPGLDNLVGVPVLGHQALTQKDKQAGELALAFTAETQLSEEYAAYNNLFRDSSLNRDQAEKGYLEANRRIRALKLRGHRSDALLMPLESIAYTGVDISQLQEGDVFDVVNGHEICRKYVLPVNKPNGRRAASTKMAKAFKRVDTKLFPEHLATDNFWRNRHELKPGREIVISQKLHGTSLRVGRVPCLRQRGRVERFLNRWFPTPDYAFDAVYGSRKVIKDPGDANKQHFYDFDLWSWYGEKIADLVPEGYLVYGEIIGYLPGTDTPIQKNYTYNLPVGECELYVYRVATINTQGTLADLPWDAVKEFCLARGLKWTPEMGRVSFGPQTLWSAEDIEQYVNELMDMRYADYYDEVVAKDEELAAIFERPIPLSDKKTVDEGVVLRQEGIVPVLLKARAAGFLLHESKLLDAEEQDIESAA